MLYILISEGVCAYKGAGGSNWQLNNFRTVEAIVHAGGSFTNLHLQHVKKRQRSTSKRGSKRLNEVPKHKQLQHT